MPKCGRKAELPPFESYIGGVMSEGFLNRNAPFGTQFTPTFRTKIIGGKARYVKETQSVFPLAVDNRQQPTLHKLTHDDGVQTDFEEPHSHHSVRTRGNQTVSGDLKSHSVLPPIPPSHNKQSGSTMTQVPPINNSNHSHNNASNTQNPQNNPMRSQKQTEYEAESSQSSIPHIPYEPRTYDNHDIHKEHEWKPAAGYSYLPTEPICLTKDQEIFLLNKLAEDVSDTTFDQVKDVYREMASNDHQLSGWGSYTELGLALRKHGVYPNLNTLRLLASTCVSTTNIGYVDYEKLLSFLITAIKKSIESRTEQPNFYSPRDKNADPFGANVEQVGSEGNLLRMIQQQLLHSNATLNVEKLRTLFSKADRSYRLTLSQAQIKDICHKMDVPIQEAVINQMLSHCRTHGDGQYLWTDFIDILEKVQPHATGLPIPTSKRPLEYAKKYLQPNENWPHPDPHSRLQPIDEQMLSSNSKPPFLTNEDLVAREKEYATPVPARTLQHQHISAPAGHANRSYQSDQQQISPRGLGLQQIPKAQPWSKNDHDPWFDGFKKLAEAFYRHDLSRKGSIKPDECKWLVTEYNEIYDLQLHAEDINRCIHRNTTISGTEIDGLLQHLLTLRQS